MVPKKTRISGGTKKIEAGLPPSRIIEMKIPAKARTMPAAVPGSTYSPRSGRGAGAGPDISSSPMRSR